MLRKCRLSIAKGAKLGETTELPPITLIFSLFFNAALPNLDGRGDNLRSPAKQQKLDECLRHTLVQLYPPLDLALLRHSA